MCRLDLFWVTSWDGSWRWHMSGIPILKAVYCFRCYCPQLTAPIIWKAVHLNGTSQSPPGTGPGGCATDSSQHNVFLWWGRRPCSNLCTEHAYLKCLHLPNLERCIFQGYGDDDTYGCCSCSCFYGIKNQCCSISHSGVSNLAEVTSFNHLPLFSSFTLVLTTDYKEMVGNYHQKYKIRFLPSFNST